MTELAQDIWETLSTLDVNAHTEKKGQFTYLSWTWAWAAVKHNYPLATYSLLADQVYEDGTREVRVSVTIEDLCHVMWLPVTDHRNNAIPNPNAFDVNTARMRCLVKCLAMFGLGHYIYAGESIPAPSGLPDSIKDELLAAMHSNDALKFADLWDSIDEGLQTMFFDSFAQGHKSKQKQIVRDLLNLRKDIVDKYVDAILDCTEKQDIDGLKELVDELDGSTKKSVWSKLSDMERNAVKQLLGV